VPYELVEFTGILEKQISDSIKEVSIYNWDEDYITRKLLSDLTGTLSTIELEGEDYRNQIDWQAYKLRGKYETNFGDIALVVYISYKDGTSLEGVAFLEAKRRDWRKTTFSAMNQRQLRRILKHAPRAQYLLYDYEDITGFINTSYFVEEISRYTPFRHSSLAEKTSSLCVPLNVADATGFKDTLLYRHGTPLSLMLTKRYFRGLDLEFDNTAKSIATGFLNNFGLPTYILKIKITEQGAKVDDQQLRLNFQEYEKLE
jgi:hypothetical protein